MLRPWQGVVCAETAHLNVDEGGAPEAMAGIKLLTVPTPDGKLTPELVERRMTRIGDEHVVQPGRRLDHAVDRARHALHASTSWPRSRDHAHAHGMLLHVDGSRLANAAAALGRRPGRRSRPTSAPTSSASAGRRSGCSRPRLVVILDPVARDALPYLRKQSMQLASKMRFVSAQLEVLLTDDLWRRAAGHANAMARAARGCRRGPT